MSTREHIRDFLIRRFVWLFSIFAHSRLFNLVRDAKAAYVWQEFKSQLGSCGEKVLIQWPVTIAGPGQVRLGNNVSLAAYVHIWGWGGVSIGNRVMIGTHTSITSQTHDYNQTAMYQTMIMKAVIIDDDVWIGSNCVIMPGVHICQGAVIGAGSVVTHDVGPNTIVAGVPARLIKPR